MYWCQYSILVHYLETHLGIIHLVYILVIIILYTYVYYMDYVQTDRCHHKASYGLASSMCTPN